MDLLKVVLDWFGRFDVAWKLTLEDPEAVMLPLAMGLLSGWLIYRYLANKPLARNIAFGCIFLLPMIPFVINKMMTHDGSVAYVFNEREPWIIHEDRRPAGYKGGTVVVEVKPKVIIHNAVWEVRSFQRIDTGKESGEMINNGVPIQVGTLRGDKSYLPVNITPLGENFLLFYIINKGSGIDLFCHNPAPECERLKNLKPGHYRAIMQLRSDESGEDLEYINLEWYGNQDTLHMNVSNRPFN